MPRLFHALYGSRLRSVARRLGLTRVISSWLNYPHRRAAQRAAEFYRQNKPNTFQGTFLERPFQLAVENEADYLRCGLFRSDRHLLDQFIGLAQPGDVFWDIGANYGLYSVCAALRVGAAGQVCCFDPVSWCCERVKRNAVLNRMQQIKVHQLALSDQSARLVMDQHAPPVSGVSRLTSDASSTTETVEARAGDEVVVSGLAPSPQVLKIDVEGHEIKVLQGLAQVLHRPSTRALMVEVHFTLLEQQGIRSPVQVISALLNEAGLIRQSWLDASHLLAQRS